MMAMGSPFSGLLSTMRAMTAGGAEARHVGGHRDEDPLVEVEVYPGGHLDVVVSHLLECALDRLEGALHVQDGLDLVLG
jgi:hypothetical protein